MSKKILLYYPPNKRTIAIETLCKTLVESGHKLVVLTLTEKGDFHRRIEQMGVETFSITMNRKPSWKYFLNQARYLIRFCKEHKIDSVWSNLQEANMIAVLAQPLLKAKVIVFRHHAESAFFAEYGRQFNMTRNKNEVRFDKIINKLAKTIVVPSSGVWFGMEKYEKCNMSKVKLIPYIYDFSAYQNPDPIKVQLLRKEYECNLLLIMVCRMIDTKQHLPVFRTIKKITDEGLSIKLIVMDDGPLKSQLEEYIRTNSLHNIISLVGFRNDFINYMAAADLLVHPSLTEASNSVVKEIGLLEKTAVVCKDVGDFNDYIIDLKNGFLIERNDLDISLDFVIRKAYSNKNQLNEMGINLKIDILQRFSNSEKNISKYLELVAE